MGGCSGGLVRSEVGVDGVTMGECRGQEVWKSQAITTPKKENNDGHTGTNTTEKVERCQTKAANVGEMGTRGWDRSMKVEVTTPPN